MVENDKNAKANQALVKYALGRDTLTGQLKSIISILTIEILETREAFYLLSKVADGGSLSRDEKKQVYKQAKDILRSLGLAAVVILPGGTLLIFILLRAARHLGIELLPSAATSNFGHEV